MIQKVLTVVFSCSFKAENKIRKVFLFEVVVFLNQARDLFVVLPLLCLFHLFRLLLLQDLNIRIDSLASDNATEVLVGVFLNTVPAFWSTDSFALELN